MINVDVTGFVSCFALSGFREREGGARGSVSVASGSPDEGKGWEGGRGVCVDRAGDGRFGPNEAKEIVQTAPETHTTAPGPSNTSAVSIMLYFLL